MGEKYLIDYDELVNIANAIRQKNNESETNKMSVSDMPIKIANLTGETLLKLQDYPDYVRPEVLRIIEKVNKVKETNSIIFLAMSDNHYPSTQGFNNNEYSDYQRNKNSSILANQAAKILAYALDIDFFAHMGDTCTGAASTTPEMITKQINELLSYFREAKSDLPVFLAIGNHDNGYYYHNSMITNRTNYNEYKAQSENTNLSDEDREAAVTNANKAANTLITLCPDVVNLETTTSQGVTEIDTSGMDGKNYCLSGKFVYENFTKYSYTTNEAMGGIENGGYCYRDFPDKNLRVFLLNTSESLFLDPPTDKSATIEQQLWLFNKLKELNQTHPTWGFIILCHYPLDYGGANKALSRLLAAYVEGRDINLGDTTYSFNNINTAKFIAQFHGHIHNFLVDQLHDGPTSSNTNGEIPPVYKAYRIAIPNAQYNRENYYYNEDKESIDGTRWGIKFFEGDFSDKGLSAQWNKTGDRGLDSEKYVYNEESTSFVVNVINPEEQKIYSFTYGAGPEVREVAYDFDKTQYTIDFISKDNSISSSNPSTIVYDGSEYKTTLIPIEGYKLIADTISIKMGGIEIKDEEGILNIDTGEIIIPNVTGNIEISAYTEIAAYYTVTYELTNINKGLAPDKVINEGTPSYLASFVPQDDLLINPYLTTVAMGGQDITNLIETIDDGYQLNIAEVTGPIVVHMEAYASNLWMFAEEYDNSNIYNNGYGYANNTRLSSGSDTAAQSGYVTTGFIPYKVYSKQTPPTIEIIGADVDINKSALNVCRAHVSNPSNKTTRRLINTSDSKSYGFSEAFTITADTNTQHYIMVPKINANGHWIVLNTGDAEGTLESSYIRFSLPCEDGKNLIIHAGEGTEAPATLYNITYNTGNLNVTNKTTTQVKENAEYTTQILDTVKYILDGDPIITMGDIDITSEVWDLETRTVMINNVTGNIEITANEIEVELTYDNLVADPGLNYGYTDGYRLNSSGVLAESSGWTVTGFIEWNANSGPIRLGGEEITFYETGSSNARLIFYDENQQPFSYDGSAVTVALQGSWGPNGSNQKTGTVDTSENTVFTFYADTSIYADAKYFRISAKGEGANMIVTINEPIG